MFHFPNLRWTTLQAEAIGIPQVTEETPGVKEQELADLSRALLRAKEAYRLEGICTGALASVYQKTRVESVCSSLGLRCLSPLWGIDPEAYLKALVDRRFQIAVVSVSALGLGDEWLGKILDQKAIDELVVLGKKYKFHAALEGGEGETLVLDAPFFSRRIEVVSASKHWKGDSGYLDITEAVLVPK